MSLHKDYFDKFKKLKIKTDGTEESMTDLITGHGFGLPSEDIQYFSEWVTVFDENDKPYEKLQQVPRHYFGFTLSADVIYTRLTLSYIDALAEELILLRTLKLI